MGAMIFSSLYIGVDDPTNTPKTRDQVQHSMPATSLPSGDDLSSIGYAKVFCEEYPTYDPKTHKAVKQGIALINGLWVEGWAVIPLTPEEIAALEAYVPFQVTRRQGLLAMEELNLLATIYAVLDGLPEPMKTTARIEFDTAVDFQRTWPTLLAVAQAVGWSNELLDNMFRIAGRK